MSRIQKLSEDLISKIAAGEVIERPFSVVKELVENSIDAGSSEIHVDVEEGGRKKIVILDNGIGMTEAEAQMCLERHATSKIRSDEDLFNIHTLGFRGEAMPSIAAISFMTLETIANSPQPPLNVRGGEEAIGVRFDIEGGKVLKKSASSLTQGTRISIERLFFNTPARLKFLKSKETEFSHISNWLESMALCRPDIQFTLKHQGKTELWAPAVDDLRWRIKDVLGEEIAEFSRRVDFKRGDMSVYGYVTDHRVTSTSSKSIFFL
ncbi:MAG: ATP-binding protein [Deltaproteobacteria bacterium]|nr:MAG: ATP-binding protein [Deltaproteobacteria bacterium]